MKGDGSRERPGASKEQPGKAAEPGRVVRPLINRLFGMGREQPGRAGEPGRVVRPLSNRLFGMGREQPGRAGEPGQIVKAPSRGQERTGIGSALDDERVRLAASQYEVIKYSRFNDALLVVLNAPPIMSSREVGPAPVEATIDINTYLSIEDQKQAESVFKAVDALASLLGYEIPYDERLDRGSIFRSAKANLRRGLDSEEALGYRAKLNQAIDLIAIGERQAKVNSAEAEAFAKVLASLGDIPSACVRVGSMLVVKYMDSHGPIVLVRPLSALELRTLERFPGIQQDPRKAIETLATAVIAAETVEENGS